MTRVLDSVDWSKAVAVPEAELICRDHPVVVQCQCHVKGRDRRLIFAEAIIC